MAAETIKRLLIESSKLQPQLSTGYKLTHSRIINRLLVLLWYTGIIKYEVYVRISHSENLIIIIIITVIYDIGCWVT